MNRNTTITHVTLWVNRFICLLLAVFVVLLPLLLRWYAGARPLTDSARYAILLAFYPCSIASPRQHNRPTLGYFSTKAAMLLRV